MGSQDFYKTTLKDGEQLIAIDKQIENIKDEDIKDDLFEKLMKENKENKGNLRMKTSSQPDEIEDSSPTLLSQSVQEIL